MRKKINNEIIFKKKIKFMIYFIIMIFFFLIGSFFYVMIISNNKYKSKLEEISYKEVLGSSSPRGRILDRNGKVIVDNQMINVIVYKEDKKTSYKEMIELAYTVSKHLELDYHKVSDISLREFYLYKSANQLEELISKDEYKLYEMGKLSSIDLYNMKLERISDDIISKFSDDDIKASYLFYLMRNGYSYQEKIIKSNVSDYELAYISENNDVLTGFDTKIDWIRYYPYGDSLKSILGSVSSSSQGIPIEDKKYYLERGYSLNDRVGLSYLEKQYEDYLKGDKAIYKIINSKEMVLVKNGSCGNDIVLSIDIDLQTAIEDILITELYKTKREANTKYYDHSSVVIQEPYSGEVLAIASKKLINGEVVDNVNSMLVSPVTPGSVVKGASMLVAYDSGAIKIGEKMYDECIKISGAPKKCSSVLDLGVIDDIVALAKSSNVYQFKGAIRVNGQEYSSGMRLNFNQSSFDKYRKMYRSFGLGELTGIDLPIESSGYSSIDKNAGNLLDFVMGQYETYTPLQLSQYINTIANGGSRYKMNLVSKVIDNNGAIIYEYEPVILNKVNVSDTYMNRVKEGFHAVMHMSGGYGRNYIDRSYNAAGKTGTSQSFIDTDNNGVIDTETITSSFVGYVPSDNPKYSIMVTSPNSSYQTSNDFMSMVTLRITKEVSKKYYEMYGL